MNSFGTESKNDGECLRLNKLSVNNFDECWKRIREATQAKSDSDVAKILGITYQSIIAARKRNQIPPGWLFIIAHKFNIYADWLYFGTGTKEKGGSPESHQPNVISCADDMIVSIDNYCFVPMVEARLSGGNGEVVYSEGIKDYYAFRKHFINYIATNPKNLVLMKVAGTSMEPEIKDGGTVMVDLGRKHPKGGCIFALGFGDVIMVKEIELLPADRVRIISKNKADYPPYETELKDIRIIGQIIWGDRSFPI